MSHNIKLSEQPDTVSTFLLLWPFVVIFWQASAIWGLQSSQLGERIKFQFHWSPTIIAWRVYKVNESYQKVFCLLELED